MILFIILVTRKTFGYVSYGRLFFREHDQLQFLTPLLMRSAETGSVAIQRLSFRIISYRDIIPNNVIWKTMTEPIIIDWELAGLMHPTIKLNGF